MYLKPRKYQVGGIAYTPYLPAQAGTAQESTSSSSSSSSSSSDKISGTFTKEIVDILKENGIPSDVDTFLNYANTSLNKMKSLSLTGESDDYDISDVIKIQQLANKVKFNKGLYDNATDNLTKEMAWSEVAIDNRGYMYAYGEDGLTKVSASEYYKDPEKYSLLTNSDLLSYRENQGAFNSDILNNVKNAVGMQSITNYLRDTIKNFGKSSIEGYATKDRDAILNGFHNLMTNGPEGYYKAKAENQVNDTTKAISYLYNTLPNNMKQLLRAKTAAEGGNPNGNDIFELLVQALTEHTSYTYSAEFDKSATDFDPQMTGRVGGSASKTSSEQLTENNYLQRVGNLRGDRTVVSIAPRAAKISDTAALSAHAFTFGAVIDRNNKPIEKMSLTDLMKEGWAFAAGEPNDVSFGNKLLKSWEKDAIMFDDNSNLTAVMLPYKNQGGHIVPDFDLFDGFNKLQQILQDNPYISATELNIEAAKLGVSPSQINYDQATNTITLKDTMAFLTVSAYAGDDTLDLSKDEKRYLEKLDKADGQHVADLYNNMTKFGKLRPAKKGNVSIKGYAKSEANDFWRGNIFVPMKNAFNAMNLSGIGEYVPKEQESNFYERVAAKQQEVAMAQYLRDNDPNYAYNSKIGQFNDEW